MIQVYVITIYVIINMSDAGAFSIQDLLENVLDENVENVLNDENVLNEIFDENVENVENYNSDFSSNNFDNNDFGFNTNFTFILDDKKNDDNSLLYKNHDIRTQSYEGFDNKGFDNEGFDNMQIDTMENSKISNKTCCVEETDNLSDDNDSCFNIYNQEVSSGKIVKTVKRKTKKKRKMTNVDIKEQPKKKKTRNTPFEAGSNILKLDDCSVYKITNIYAGERAGVWKADVEQVFPEGGLLDTIVIDKDKYVPYNTII